MPPERDSQEMRDYVVDSRFRAKPQIGYPSPRVLQEGERPLGWLENCLYKEKGSGKPGLGSPEQHVCTSTCLQNRERPAIGGTDFSQLPHCMPQSKLSKWSSIAHSCHNTALALKLPIREKTRPWSTEMTQSLGRAWWDWWCPLLFLKQGMGLPASLVVFFPWHILASFVEDKACIGLWIYLWAF